MDARLLDILVCPSCKGPLIYKKDDKELICKPDRLAFAIKDGIPVMLIDEARRLRREVHVQGEHVRGCQEDHKRHELEFINGTSLSGNNRSASR